MSQALSHPIDGRAEPRDEVHHRCRAMLTDRRTLSVLAVNLSPQGVMIRSDAEVSVGEWLRVTLPVVGEMQAAVRWALGGRIGCQFEKAIPANQYHAVLGAMQG